MYGAEAARATTEAYPWVVFNSGILEGGVEQGDVAQLLCRMSMIAVNTIALSSMKKQKRAGEATLAKIHYFLEDLRSLKTLTEKRPGVFYLHGKELIHFHEIEGAIVADIFLSRERLRLAVTTRSDQLDALDRLWGSIGQPENGHKPSKRNGKG